MIPEIKDNAVLSALENYVETAGGIRVAKAMLEWYENSWEYGQNPERERELWLERECREFQAKLDSLLGGK